MSPSQASEACASASSATSANDNIVANAVVECQGLLSGSGLVFQFLCRSLHIADKTDPRTHTNLPEISVNGFRDVSCEFALSGETGSGLMIACINGEAALATGGNESGTPNRSKALR
jgi:hypothetical protein